ncbi:hypothetical protein IFR05_017480, partial [Cadophora sp. M221]
MEPSETDISEQNIWPSARVGNLDTGYSLPQGSSIIGQECCYGMLLNIPVRLSVSFLEPSKYLPVFFAPPNTIRLEDPNRHETFEVERYTHLFVLKQLATTNDISIQLYCSAKLAKRKPVGLQLSWTL